MTHEYVFGVRKVTVCIYFRITRKKKLYAFPTAASLNIPLISLKGARSYFPQVQELLRKTDILGQWVHSSFLMNLQNKATPKKYSLHLLKLKLKGEKPSSADVENY